MNTMTDKHPETTQGEATSALESLLQRAESTDPDWALTNETPLSLEVSGKYVHVLFSWGGPSTELLAEYTDAGDAEYWFESEPAGAWFTYKDWGTREDRYIGPDDAYGIMQAITRDPDELGGDE